MIDEELQEVETVETVPEEITESTEHTETEVYTVEGSNPIYYIDEGEMVTASEFNATMNTVIELQTEQLEALNYMYTAQVFCIGVIASVFVTFLLYKFLKIVL